MIQKLKEYGIVALISIVSTVAIYTYILNNQKSRNEKLITDLQGQIQILDRLSKEQADKNKVMQDTVNKLEVSVEVAHKNTSDAIAVLEKLQKPVTIQPTNSVEEVRVAIQTNYNDNNVDYNEQSQKFGIFKSTTFNLVTDAIQWKVNGPILNTRLNATENALQVSQSENNVKDRLIISQKDLIGGLNNSLTLCNESGKDKDKVITLYERNLKVESMNGNIKFIVGTAVGAGTYYIVDKLRKK